jgi:hypothetical protein
MPSLPLKRRAASAFGSCRFERCSRALLRALLSASSSALRAPLERRIRYRIARSRTASRIGSSMASRDQHRLQLTGL